MSIHMNAFISLYIIYLSCTFSIELLFYNSKFYFSKNWNLISAVIKLDSANLLGKNFCFHKEWYINVKSLAADEWVVFF